MDVRLAAQGITAHITHMKQPEDAYFKVITVATPEYVEYKVLKGAIAAIYREAHDRKISALGDLIITWFVEVGVGAAPCHHKDNFSRAEGRIRAKGRLAEQARILKRINAERERTSDITVKEDIK